MHHWHSELKYRLGVLFPLMLLSAFLGGLLVLMAVKYTGLGEALTLRNPQVEVEEKQQTAPEPAPDPTPLVKETEEKPQVVDMEKATIAVVKKVRPAVVMISTSKLVEVNDYFFGPSGYREVQGLGSGVIFRKDGYILTNNHVISRAEKIMVVLADGRSVEGKVIGADPYTDLAVVKVDLNNLPVAKLGDSDKLQVGQLAIAIGNPLEQSLNNTVTTGVVSALERTIRLSDGTPLRRLIQTDASINPGNSGGPLLDSKGQVIGINSAIIQEAQGIGFAIPINTAKSIADQLIKEGRVRRGSIGITYIYFNEHTKTLAERQFRMKLPANQGFLITAVRKGGPADKAGLYPGDVVVKLNGSPVVSQRGFQDVVANTKIGEAISVEFYRGEELMKKTIRVEEATD
mgnify:CR=1 FL=1